MSILIDVLLVAVVVGIIVWCANKGILVTIAEVLAFILAIFLAAKTAEPVAKVMYKAFFYKSVQEAIYNDPNLAKVNGAGDKAALAFDNMPEFARKQAEKSGITKETIKNQITKTTFGDGDLYEELEDKIVRPIAVMVLKHILFFFLAIIYGILLRIVFVAFAKGSKNSKIVEKTDKTVGGIIGIAEGLVIVYLLCTLLTYISPRIENESMRQAVSESRIVSFCDNFEPMEAVNMASAFVNEK